MKSRVLSLAVLSAGLSMPAVSQTVIVVADPDDVAAGTGLTAAFPELTMTAFGGCVSPPVLSLEATSTTASTGTRVFGHPPSTCPLSDTSDLWFSSPGESAYFRVDFAIPTDFVAIDVIPNDPFDPAVLRAFDCAGDLVDAQTTSGTSGAGVAETAMVVSPAPEIAYVTVENPGEVPNSFALDHLRYRFFCMGEPCPTAAVRVATRSRLRRSNVTRSRPALSQVPLRLPQRPLFPAAPTSPRPPADPRSLCSALP